MIRTYILLILSITFAIFLSPAPSLDVTKSDTGSLSRLFSPLSATVRAFIFIATRLQLFLHRDGSYVLPAITRNVAGTYVTWIFRRNVPLFLVTVPPDTPQHQGGASSKFKTPRHTQHTAHLPHTAATAHSKQQHHIMSEETPLNLHSEPDGLQGRPALLQLATITKRSVDQSKAQVKCNLCAKLMAGTTERMAAHFAKRTNFGVAKCTKPTSEATALGKKVLGEFEAERASTRKRKAEHSSVKSRQTFLRCKDNGEGKEAADETFMRFLLATGQFFSVGESPYFRDFVTAVSKVPGWTARERRTLAGTDIDEEYRNVDVESKARLERNGLQRGKTLQTDGMTIESFS